MMMLRIISKANHSDLSYFGESTVGKGLRHYLLQHFDPILSSHFASFWFLMLLSLGLLRLVSSVNYYLTAEFFSVGDEVLSCEVDFYSFEFVENVHFCDEIFNHESLSKDIFVDQCIKILHIFFILILSSKLTCPYFIN